MYYLKQFASCLITGTQKEKRLVAGVINSPRFPFGRVDVFDSPLVVITNEADLNTGKATSFTNDFVFHNIP